MDLTRSSPHGILRIENAVGQRISSNDMEQYVDEGRTFREVFRQSLFQLLVPFLAPQLSSRKDIEHHPGADPILEKTLLQLIGNRREFQEQFLQKVYASQDGRQCASQVLDEEGIGADSSGVYIFFCRGKRESQNEYIFLRDR